MAPPKRKGSDARQSRRLQISEEGDSQDSATHADTPSADEPIPKPAPNKQDYDVNSMVLCQHTDNNFYEAKVIKVERDAVGQPIYTIHYNGWNSRYDETLSHGEASTRFLEYTEENKNYAKQIYTAAKQKKTKRKDDARRRKSGGRGPNTSGTVTPNLDNESVDTPMEDSFVVPAEISVIPIATPKPKPVKVELSEALLELLDKDGDIMNTNTKLLKPPTNSNSINRILEDYYKSISLKKPAATKALLRNRVDTVKKAFGDALQRKLLYKFENVQFLNVMNKLRTESNLVEIPPKEYFARYYLASDDLPESDISDDDTDKPPEAIAPHLKPGPSEKIETPEKRTLRSKKDTSDKRAGKDMKKKASKSDLAQYLDFKPDYTPHYGIIHLLRYIVFCPFMNKTECINVMIYNYFAEILNDLVEFLNQNYNDYFNESDYDVAPPAYVRAFNAHTAAH